MVASSLAIVGSFLVAFKAVLLEGSEVAILSLATVQQLGRKNVTLGVLVGVLGSLALFLGVRQVFLLLPEIVIDFATAAILLYFSSRFIRGFARYYFGKKSFREKMTRLEREVVTKDLVRTGGEVPAGGVPFSLLNSIPVIAITLTEGFEASLVLAAAGTIDVEWTTIGALLSVVVLVSVSAVSYDYLLRVPRWLLDLIAGAVLLTFGLIFLVGGVLGAL